ncbi:hypothetical protein CEQ90_17985 [Lewinellaceae bacterium SD302]|nr:hypothetical protein CEQ90_17985 [Lewinellaceae bacterium SD302]
MNFIYTFLFSLFLLATGLNAQQAFKLTKDYDPETEKVYKVNALLEGGTALLGMGTTVYFFQKINDKDGFSPEGLDRDDVPGIDRWAFPASSDQREEAGAASDAVFYPSMALPFTLFFSKKIRKDWVDITAMYFQAQAINGLLYAASPLGPNFRTRERPVAYYPELFEDDEKAPGKDINSFFSGHVSSAATGTFFFAKVLSDYNPQWNGLQKALVFGAASLPPLFVGVQRVRALRHFPTDVAVGYGLGAVIGILTPHIHKRWQQKHRTSLSLSGGYGGGAAAMGFSLTF